MRRPISPDSLLHARAPARGLIPALLALVALAAGLNAAEPKLTAEFQPNPLAPNQTGSLSITVDNGMITNLPQPVLPDGLTLAGRVQKSQEVRSNFGGMSSSSITLEWPVRALREGTFTIPSFVVPVNGKAMNTRELRVEVTSQAQAASPVGPASGQDNGLGDYEPILQMHLTRTEFYQGEVVPITATLFIPRVQELELQRTGLIEVEKPDLAIQRFPQQGEQSLETIGNMRYLALNYRSSLSALKAGRMKVGPAKMEIALGVAVDRRRLSFGFLEMETRKVTVKAPEIQINVLPLPSEGRPASFAGAVGDFTLSASTSTTDIAVGDPVAVDLLIEGTGNFDALEAPKLDSSSGWKTYSAKKYNVDGNDPNTTDLMNRRIGFNQIIVPEKLASEVPPFELSFFNPKTKQYVKLRTNPIPITMRPGSAPPPAQETPAATDAGRTTPPTPAPEADITDILMPVATQPRWSQATVPLMRSPMFLGINAALLMALVAVLGNAFWKRSRERKEVSETSRRAELKRELESAGLKRAEFYQRAAFAIQQICGSITPPEARFIIERFEALNFTGAGSHDEALDPAERAQVTAVIDALKPRRAGLPPPIPSAASIATLLLLSGVPLAGASPQDSYRSAAELLEKKDYAKAATAAEALVNDGSIGPDVFALLGHANYKQGKPGIAAMWYQRARLFPNSAPELRQNLRHISEKTHYLDFQPDDGLRRYGLLFSQNTWTGIAAAGAWLTLFALAGVILNRARWWCVAAMPVGLLIVAAGMLGHAARPGYPDLKNLAFVTKDHAQTHTAATQVSGSVIALPAGSVVRKVEQRGTWTYVEIPQETEPLRGWLPSSQLQDYWPYDPAMLP